MPARPVVDPAIEAAEGLARDQGGVVSRRQLYACGVTRWMIRAQVQGGRWRRVGDQSVCLHNGPMERRGHLWAAVFQGGPRACLDGVAALEASGLRRFEEPKIRVSVPRGARVRRTTAYDIRQTRRWTAADVLMAGIPRTRPEVAAVRAALWAASDRQASLVMIMAVQQGLTSASQLAGQVLRIRRDRRRGLAQAVVLELVGGVRSLDELDFARECRVRGLPEPSRQVVRRGRNGRYYLDAVWEEWRVVVEVDGIHHSWVENIVDDALRHNSVTLDDAVVLRVPVLGLRTSPDAFFAQILEALRAAGCPDVMRAERSGARHV